MKRAIVSITHEAFWSLLANLDGSRRLRSEGLPPGARVIAVQDNFRYGSFDVVIEADTLQNVPDGEPYPRLEWRIEAVDWPSPDVGEGVLPPLSMEDLGQIVLHLNQAERTQDWGAGVLSIARRLLAEVGRLRRQEEHLRGVLSDRVQDSELAWAAAEQERRRCLDIVDKLCIKSNEDFVNITQAINNP